MPRSKRPKVEEPNMGLKQVPHMVRIGFQSDSGGTIQYSRECSNALEIQPTLEELLEGAKQDGFDGKPNMITVQPVKKGE